MCDCKCEENRCFGKQLIITAFLCANKNIRVTGLPVSVRESDNCSMSNHASGIAAEYSYSDNLSFPDNARKLHAIIMGELEKHRWFVIQFLSRMPATLIDSVLLYTHGLYKCEKKRSRRYKSYRNRYSCRL